MYEAYLEFLEGWGGGVRKNSFRGGGMDIFWNYTMYSYGAKFKEHCLIFLEIFLVECCTVLVKPAMTPSISSFA